MLWFQNNSMIKNLSLKIIFVFNFFLSTFFINAQQSSTLKQVIASVDTFNTKLPAEQLYLHFDKNNYATGDTIWFKAYLLERATHAYSPLSGILYVELISDSNRLVKRLSFPAAYGVSWGQIYLDKEDVPEGNYFIRSYTNWMQNFGEDYFYHHPISISDPLSSNWLVKEEHSIVSSGDKTDIDFTLQLNNADHTPEKQKEVAVKITKAKKNIYSDDLQTNPNGIIKAKFSIPSTAIKGSNIVVQDKTNPTKRSIIPLLFNRSENIDLQFMPESGNMVAGISSNIGFKALDENGIGIEVEGNVVDSKNTVVASFRSIHRGMGMFQFTPVKGENYSAILTLPNANTKHFSLPAVKNNGIILQVDNEQNSDSLKLLIKVSPDFIDNKIYHLLGLSRGVVCYAAGITLKSTEIKATVAKNIFPSGVAHFTLLNSLQQPVNERMIFIDHADNLNISIASYKNNFSARDSIPFHISVTDKQGKPVAGSFSLAVTDDAQVKTDELTAENIVTRMLLTADLKGNVEAPDYYTNNSGSKAWQALDALLLTQGWIGYYWTKIMNPPTPLFIAEHQFSVRGKVTNLLGSPINKAHVTLMSSGSRLNVKDTSTNKKGEFVFTNFKRLDSLSFFIDARNAKDKKFGIGLTVDEFKPAQLKPLSTWNTIPWYVNSDSTIINFAQNKLRLDTQLYQSGIYKRLQEVKIKGKKIITGSLNLNGAGNADQIIDEAEIEKEAGNKNLLQLLKEKVKGFITIYRGDAETYKINSSPVLFIIDGINLARFGSARETLEYLDAEDVKGIEVMYTTRNKSRYESEFFDVGQISANIAFVEITTRSGNGIFFKKLPGLMIYKPVPVVLPVQFYSPKYVVKNLDDKTKDLRSTVYWQPSLVTNKTGEANTYFYAADTPTTYTIIIQGSDINGSVGYKVEKFSIR